MTLSEENYLKSIFSLQKEHPDGVSTNVLAQYLNTKPASTTEMIKKLRDKDLAHYRPYQGVLLNERGERHALSVIRKHRLWETFLVEKLNFNWDEIHDVAEQLEHIRSEKLVEELDRFLDFPKYDPHGDAIPDAEGNMPIISKKKVSQLQAGDQGKCIGVNDTSSSFLQFLDKQGIKLGSWIKIVTVEHFDKSMAVQVEGREVVLSKIATDNIYLRVEKSKPVL